MRLVAPRSAVIGRGESPPLTLPGHHPDRVTPRLILGSLQELRLVALLERPSGFYFPPEWAFDPAPAQLPL